jgi:hypothetical protein
MQKTLEISTASRVIKNIWRGQKLKEKVSLKNFLLFSFFHNSNFLFNFLFDPPSIEKAMQKTLEISTA